MSGSQGSIPAPLPLSAAVRRRTESNRIAVQRGRRHARSLVGAICWRLPHDPLPTLGCTGRRWCVHGLTLPRRWSPLLRVLSLFCLCLAARHPPPCAEDAEAARAPRVSRLWRLSLRQVRAPANCARLPHRGAEDRQVGPARSQGHQGPVKRNCRSRTTLHLHAIRQTTTNRHTTMSGRRALWTDVESRQSYNAETSFYQKSRFLFAF